MGVLAMAAVVVVVTDQVMFLFWPVCQVSFLVLS